MIIKKSKQIAKYMGYTHEYQADIYRNSSKMENVNFLSKVRIPLQSEMTKEELSSEAIPFVSHKGAIAIGKYGASEFYNNVIIFSTDSDKIPLSLDGYNKRVSQYHSSWDWLIPILNKLGLKDMSYSNIYETFEKIDIKQILLNKKLKII